MKAAVVSSKVIFQDRWMHLNAAHYVDATAEPAAALERALARLAGDLRTVERRVAELVEGRKVRAELAATGLVVPVPGPP
jgi:hypothetical protein